MSTLNVTAKLGLDGSGFEKGLDKAGRGAREFARDELGELKGMLAGVFSTAAVAGFGRALIEMGSHTKDVSQRLGLTTDEVQELGFAAAQSGSDIDEVARGIEHIAKAREEVIKGGEGGRKMAETFARMGVSFEDVIRNNPKETFLQLAKGLEDANVSGRIQAGILELMGKSAGKLIPVMQELGAKSKEIRDAGGILKKSDIDALDDAGDRLQKIGQLAKVAGAKSFLGLASIPEMLGRMAGGGPAFVSQSQKDLKADGADAAGNPVVSMALARRMAAAMRATTTTNEGRKAMDLADAIINNAAKPEAAAEKKGDRPRLGGVNSDSLLSVGNFLGSGGQQVMSAPIRAIEENTRRTADNTEKLHQTIRSLNISNLFP